MIARKSLSIATSAAMAASLCMAAPAMAACQAAPQGSKPSTQSAQNSQDKQVSPIEEAEMTALSTSTKLSTTEKKRAAILMDKLVNRFAAGGFDCQIDHTTMDAALGLQAFDSVLGVNYWIGDLIDSDHFLWKLQNDDSIKGADLAKYLVGFDIAQGGLEPPAELKPYIKKLPSQARAALAEDTTEFWLVDSAVWLLPALVRYQPKEIDLIEQCAWTILNAQGNNGLIANSYESTARAIWALRSIENNESLVVTPQARKVIKALVSTMETDQLDEGSWPYDAGSIYGDVNATAWALYALSGKDTKDDVKGASAKAVRYLLSKADKDLEYFNKAELADEPASAAAVMFGLSCATQAGFITIDPATLDKTKDPGTLLTPSKVTKVSAKSGASNKLVVSWSNSAGKKLAVDGYQVYVYKGSKLVKKAKARVTHNDQNQIVYPSKTTVKLTSKYTGKKLTVKVRAYRDKNNLHKAVYGPWSDKASTKPVYSIDCY